MKRSTLRSSAGFSLVELMVVVAIIGILAAMSVGQVQKQIAKARQSEAKTNLASLYTAEKSFYSEFSTYNVDFTVLGLGYEGNLRYEVGFSGATPGQAEAVAAGYTGTAGTGIAAAGAFCTAAGTCTIINTNGAAPAAVSAAGVAAASTFTAEANCEIYQSGTSDIWTITESKVIANPTPGIP